MVAVVANDVDHPGGDDDAVGKVDVLDGDGVGGEVEITRGDGDRRGGADVEGAEGDGGRGDQVAVDPDVQFVVR